MSDAHCLLGTRRFEESGAPGTRTPSPGPVCSQPWHPGPAAFPDTAVHTQTEEAVSHGQQICSENPGHRDLPVTSVGSALILLKSCICFSSLPYRPFRVPPTLPGLPTKPQCLLLPAWPWLLPQLAIHPVPFWSSQSLWRPDWLWVHFRRAGRLGQDPARGRCFGHSHWWVELMALWLRTGSLRALIVSSRATQLED